LAGVWFRIATRAGLIALVVVAGGWMIRSKPPSSWVSVDADGDAFAGRLLRIRVKVPPPRAAEEMLVVDLHWLNRRREPQGYLSGSAPSSVPARGGFLEFRVPVPSDERLGYVFAVIYAGPTGLWRDRVRSAYTDPVAVHPPRWSSLGPDRWLRWNAHDPVLAEESPQSPSRLAQWLCALTWLGAATLCLRQRHALEHTSSPVAQRPRILIFCVLGCVAAACWELASADVVVSETARRLAARAHLYHERETPQMVATVAVLGASWLALRVVEHARAPRGIRWMLLGLAIFSVVSAVAAISHHVIDRIAYAAWWGVPAMQWMKIASGGLALAGAAMPLVREASPARRPAN